MDRYRKKICLLFCGGTALSKSGGRFLEVKKSADIEPWLMHFQELEIMAEIEPVFVFGGRAANVTAKEWLKLAKAIKTRLKTADGFVVMHGPQTMNYTACALSFALQNLNKPIILTGSPLSALKEEKKKRDVFSEYKGLGVKANLLNAVQVASTSLDRVAILFGSRLIAGVQAVQAEPPGLNFFDSYSGNYLGRVDFGISLSNQPKRQGKKVKFNNRFDTKVSVFDYHPGLDVSLVSNLNRQRVHGLIIRMHHQNILPDKFIKSLKSLSKNKIPVVIYEAGPNMKIGQSANFITVNNMSLAATLVKLMWILGQTGDLKKIRKMMNKNLAGEIS